MTLGPGETLATFTIAIVDDELSDPWESFRYKPKFPGQAAPVPAAWCGLMTMDRRSQSRAAAATSFLLSQGRYRTDSNGGRASGRTWPQSQSRHQGRVVDGPRGVGRRECGLQRNVGGVGPPGDGGQPHYGARVQTVRGFNTTWNPRDPHGASLRAGGGPHRLVLRVRRHRRQSQRHGGAITVTFYNPPGPPVVDSRTLPPRSRDRIRMNAIPGLEDTPAGHDRDVGRRSPAGRRAHDHVGRRRAGSARVTGNGRSRNPATRPCVSLGGCSSFRPLPQRWFSSPKGRRAASTRPWSSPTRKRFMQHAGVSFSIGLPSPVHYSYSLPPLSRTIVYCGDIPELAGRAFAMEVLLTGHGTVERMIYWRSPLRRRSRIDG